ncbi:hypothetical protein V491_07895 [Pseudogymnoascus sp. VKM F-3775]|nr:hypothetical protein V491_07895 [Pseudogymnoascus sp. VKM F-3775]
MSSQNQGRQSPSSENQSPSQRAPISTGQSADTKPSSAESAKDQLKDLESNPRPVLENHVEEMFKKTMPQKKD